MNYEQLAYLFEYPGEDYKARCADVLPEAEALSTEQLQELFVQTFDMNPDCALDIGWHLFGEQYERGEFLVKVRGLLRRYEVQETAELPDHLTNVLRLLGRMEESEAAEFAGTFVVPALVKILGALEGKSSLFERLVKDTQAGMPVPQGVQK